jgi:hypothetical protein
LIEHVAPALREADDLDVVRELWAELVDRRPGATHQRAAFEAGGLRGVVEDAVAAAG